MKQEITLAGLGTATFNRAIAAVRKIYGLFDRAFEEGQLEPIDFLKKNEGFGSMLEVGNRYLTPRKDAPDVKATDLAKFIDPRGLLTAMIKEGLYIHREENVVEYWASMSIDGTGRT